MTNFLTEYLGDRTLQPRYTLRRLTTYPSDIEAAKIIAKQCGTKAWKRDVLPEVLRRAVNASRNSTADDTVRKFWTAGKFMGRQITYR
jgi:hypothetical protein